MTDNELRKLSRTALLEMLLRQSRETERLQAELQQAQEQLKSRELMVEEAGSIAEAALRINGVMEAAQQAAEQYLENIKRQNSHIEEKCRRMEAETQEKCQAMTELAKKQANDYWEQTLQKLKQYLSQQEGLKNLLSQLSKNAQE